MTPDCAQKSAIKSQTKSRKLLHYFLLPLFVGLAFSVDVSCFTMPDDPKASKAEEKAIKLVFRKYKRGILNRNGTVVSKLVDSNTLEYYLDLRALTLSAPEDVLRKKNLLTQLTVLRMRAQISKGRLKPLHTKKKIRKLIAYMVRKGWFPKSSVSSAGLGKIRKVKDTVTAVVTTEGVPMSPAKFHFNKEKKKWYMDLTSLNSYANSYIYRKWKDSGQSHTDFLFGLIETMQGKKIQRDLWEPMSAPRRKAKKK